MVSGLKRNMETACFSKVSVDFHRSTPLYPIAVRASDPTTIHVYELSTKANVGNMLALTGLFPLVHTQDMDVS
jgi:hypothetical protein